MINTLKNMKIKSKLLGSTAISVVLFLSLILFTLGEFKTLSNTFDTVVNISLAGKSLAQDIEKNFLNISNDFLVAGYRAMNGDQTTAISTVDGISNKINENVVIINQLKTNTDMSMFTNAEKEDMKATLDYISNYMSVDYMQRVNVLKQAILDGDMQTICDVIVSDDTQVPKNEMLSSLVNLVQVRNEKANILTADSM